MTRTLSCRLRVGMSHSPVFRVAERTLVFSRKAGVYQTPCWTTISELSGEPVSIHIVLVQPEIHWNTGNAGRTCLAAGATLHLIEPLGFSLGQRQLKRAGLDYWEHVDLRVWPDWPAFEAELPSLGEPYFFSTKAARPLWDAPLGEAGDVVLVFGRETAGL